MVSGTRRCRHRVSTAPAGQVCRFITALRYLPPGSCSHQFPLPLPLSLSEKDQQLLNRIKHLHAVRVHLQSHFGPRLPALHRCCPIDYLAFGLVLHLLLLLQVSQTTTAPACLESQRGLFVRARQASLPRRRGHLFGHDTRMHRSATSLPAQSQTIVRSEALLTPQDERRRRRNTQSALHSTILLVIYGV